MPTNNIRQDALGAVWYWGSGQVKQGSAEAKAVAVAQAYLDEHPVDDDEPVTEEWFRQSGAKDKPLGTVSGKPVSALMLGPLRWEYIEKGLFLSDDWNIATRGAARRIIEAIL